jgi:hypothetical protein
MIHLVALIVVCGGGPSPLEELTRPDPVGIQLRVLTLTEGMDQADVEKRLGLTGIAPNFVVGSIKSATYEYSISEKQNLSLSFVRGKNGNLVLRSAIVERSPGEPRYNEWPPPPRK